MKHHFTITQHDVKAKSIDDAVSMLHHKAKSRYADSRIVTIQSVSIAPTHSGMFLVCCLFEKSP